MRKTKKIAVVGTAVAALIAGGIAYAAWTSNGLGSGPATAGHDSPLTVTAATTDALYPSVPVAVTVTVSNPESYAINLDSVTWNGNDPLTNNQGCAGSNVSSGSTGLLPEAAVNRIPAHGSITKTVMAAMDVNAPDACKDATFTLFYKATGHSVN